MLLKFRLAYTVPFFWSGNMKVKDHPEYLGVCGRIILERILETGWEEVKWIHVAGCCEHGN